MPRLRQRELYSRHTLDSALRARNRPAHATQPSERGKRRSSGEAIQAPVEEISVCRPERLRSLEDAV